MTIPRPEYPRPQFAREDWLCLNGTWQFEVDADDSGAERDLRSRALRKEIVVPFCPESTLSGIGETDFMKAVWYRRQVMIPADWVGRRLLLHFQAVDCDATVWVDGREVARHRGGWTPFTADLGIVGDHRGPRGELTIVLRARDQNAVGQARGKQSDRRENWGDQYTRTTGIWQTVWLEPVPETHMLRPRITPDLAASAFHIEVPVRGPKEGVSLQVRLMNRREELATVTTVASLDFSVRVTVPIPAQSRRVWAPEDPHLYDLELELVDDAGNIVDSARSYAGLRSISIDGGAILLNGEPRFQRLVLDQGYYPDGVMTAPSEEDLIRDIELAQAAGFNGARLHQKVFEERFLYHCDRLGYMVWGEFGDGMTNARWGALPQEEMEPTPTFITQWLEALERDYSHPAIVGWCGLNESIETLGDQITVLDDVTRGMFLAAKALDLTRPVLDCSGFAHRVPEADVYDSHSYAEDGAGLAESLPGSVSGAFAEPDVEKLREGVDESLIAEIAASRGLSRDQVLCTALLPPTPWSIPYRGQPFFCSEFGGIWWSADIGPGESSWGYGERPRSVEEFYERFDSLISTLLNNGSVFGYCYTQLTDVFQEQNGVFHFNRTGKFDLRRLSGIQSKPAAIER